VRCWGANRYGQLGASSPTQSATPLAVEWVTSSVSQLASGDYHNCAIVSGGLQCWGNNQSGQLGAADPSIRTVEVWGAESKVTDVALGANHSCAVVDGAAYCWGDNSYGQLGNNTTASSSAPVAVQGLGASVVDVACGSNHSCALTSDGQVWCWGANGTSAYSPLDGQLGNPFVWMSQVPQRVQLP
jgi:alpha-tubulin suppressor-like RCC1 family protein